MSGVTRLQRWLKIELPLAFPHMMLGINQTVVFALFMVIIGAMIGTTDLGQYILKALSDRQGTGNGASTTNKTSTTKLRNMCLEFCTWEDVWSRKKGRTEFSHVVTKIISSGFSTFLFVPFE